MNKARSALQSGIFRWAFLLLALPSFLPVPLPGAMRAESRSLQSKILGRTVRYVVLLPLSYDKDKARRYPILYYLHGLGDNEQALLNGGWDLVEQLQNGGQIREFLIATPDGGRSFYVNSKDGRERYEDFFIQEFIPAMEQRYRALGTRAGRGISGTSMGGYGALRFAFRYPKLFVSASAHMAALAEDLPGGLLSGGSRSLSVFGQPFDRQFWKRNTPFTLLRESGGLDGLQIYFDCGQQDDYGFAAGARDLHELLRKQGVAHDFHLYPGRHNGEYVAAHFPDSLRFHSRTFAAKK
ncbi:MAG: hypothetical protein HY647_06155 [Acidobacteria bacterium]|nr:hypothetical protein [Acidobacteriota bacterium]